MVRKYHKAIAIPLEIKICSGYAESPDKKESLIDKCITSIISNKLFTDSIIVADSFLAVVKLSRNLMNLKKILALIVKLKSNASYCEKDFNTKTEGRGRPRKDGVKHKVNDYAQNITDWKEVEIYLYGKQEKVKIHAMKNWWRPCGRVVKYVFVKFNEKITIFMCSDCLIPAEKVVGIYGYRFRIEDNFKVEKIF